MVRGSKPSGKDAQKLFPGQREEPDLPEQLVRAREIGKVA